MDDWKAVVNGTLTLSPTNKIGKVLGLTVRGAEAKAGWRFPSIRYSINRIILHFEVGECLLPEEDWAFDTENLREVEISRDFSESTESGISTDNDWSGSISASSPSVAGKASRMRTSKKARFSGSKYSTTYTPVLAHGTASKPTWSITSVHNSKPLIGTLIKHDRFCRAEPSGPEPKVSVFFEIPYDALIFRKNDGSFVSGNKFGIIRLLLRSILCERKHFLCEKEIE